MSSTRSINMAALTSGNRPESIQVCTGCLMRPSSLDVWQLLRLLLIAAVRGDNNARAIEYASFIHIYNCRHLIACTPRAITALPQPVQIQLKSVIETTECADSAAGQMAETIVLTPVRPMGAPAFQTPRSTSRVRHITISNRHHQSYLCDCSSRLLVCTPP